MNNFGYITDIDSNFIELTVDGVIEKIHIKNIAKTKLKRLKKGVLVPLIYKKNKLTIDFNFGAYKKLSEYTKWLSLFKFISKNQHNLEESEKKMLMDVYGTVQRLFEQFDKIESEELKNILFLYKNVVETNKIIRFELLFYESNGLNILKDFYNYLQTLNVNLINESGKIYSIDILQSNIKNTLGKIQKYLSNFKHSFNELRNR